MRNKELDYKIGILGHLNDAETMLTYKELRERVLGPHPGIVEQTQYYRAIKEVMTYNRVLEATYGGPTGDGLPRTGEQGLVHIMFCNDNGEPTNKRAEIDHDNVVDAYDTPTRVGLKRKGEDNGK